MKHRLTFSGGMENVQEQMLLYEVCLGEELGRKCV